MADTPEVQPSWSRRKRDAVTVLWSSFLGATVGAIPFFAVFDPQQLSLVASIPFPGDRMSGYALLFFALWLSSALTAWLAIFMLRSYQEARQ